MNYSPATAESIAQASAAIAKARRPIDLDALSFAARVQVVECDPRASLREIHLADSLAMALEEIERMTCELREPGGLRG